jgi:hypothetical protein
MRLDLEVLDLAVEILRDEARLANPVTAEQWAEHCTDVADCLADIIDHLDQDHD